jgi:hypothetical protein
MPHHEQVETGVAPIDPLDNDFTITFGWVCNSALVSVGQIFLCDSASSGALVLSGMAISSRIAAATAYSGALAGTLLALVLGADKSAITHGLWGYNSALTAVAALTFFVPSLRSMLMAALGVALTILFEAALRTSFAASHMPIGTLPFCFAALSLMLTHSKIPGFEMIPLSDVSTAEDHLLAARVTYIKVSTDEESPAVGLSGTDAPSSAPRAQGRRASLVATQRGMGIDMSTFDASAPNAVGLPAPPAQVIPRRLSLVPMSGTGLGQPAPLVGREALVVASPGRSGHASNMQTPGASGHAGQIFRGGHTILHGGSMHGEQYVARMLEAMTSETGQSKRVTEFAARAAVAGTSPSPVP